GTFCRPSSCCWRLITWTAHYLTAVTPRRVFHTVRLRTKRSGVTAAAGVGCSRAYPSDFLCNGRNGSAASARLTQCAVWMNGIAGMVRSLKSAGITTGHTPLPYVGVHWYVPVGGLKVHWTLIYVIQAMENPG